MDLKKLTISAFNKAQEDGTGKDSVGDPYEVMINPASLSIGKQIIRNEDEKPHGKQDAPTFGSYSSDTLNFELTIDTTGLLSDATNAHQEVQKFEEVVYDYQTESHQANFLEIKWGTMIFRGYLTTLQINYNLFDSNGNALRAKVTATFTGYIPPSKFEANPSSASPDMTHLRFPNQSDTLYNYCAKIYGDPKYAIQVAQFNQLVNFRKLNPGQKLEFPPLINQR